MAISTPVEGGSAGNGGIAIAGAQGVVIVFALIDEGNKFIRHKQNFGNQTQKQEFIKQLIEGLTISAPPSALPSPGDQVFLKESIL